MDEEQALQFLLGACPRRVEWFQKVSEA
jgi:hypothetical protein